MKAINEAIARDPFEPFELVMSSGDRFRIANPGLLVFVHLHMHYAFPRSDGYVDLNVSHIAFLQVGKNDE